MWTFASSTVGRYASKVPRTILKSSMGSLELKKRLRWYKMVSEYSGWVWSCNLEIPCRTSSPHNKKEPTSEHNLIISIASIPLIALVILFLWVVASRFFEYPARGLIRRLKLEYQMGILYRMGLALRDGVSARDGSWVRMDALSFGKGMNNGIRNTREELKRVESCFKMLREKRELDGIHLRSGSMASCCSASVDQ